MVAWLVDLNVNMGEIQSLFILIVKKVNILDRSGFCLTELMSRNSFEAILTTLSYVNHDLPVLVNCFWEV